MHLLCQPRLELTFQKTHTAHRALITEMSVLTNSTKYKDFMNRRPLTLVHNAGYLAIDSHIR